MTNQDNRPKDAADLRQKAEAIARERTARTPEDSAALSPEEIRKTLHELRVHQIELEMQNEELRTAQTQIEAGRARYFDLYDLAPDGYCTLSEQGLILEANLTAANLLGSARGALINQPISRFILRDDQDIYYLHRKKLFETGETQECELRLVKPDGARFWAHLTGTAAQAEDGAPVYRVVISDMTERRRAEQARQESALLIERIINMMPARVFWKDSKLVYLGCNALFAHDAGFADPKELIGKDDFQMGWREQAEAYRADDRAVIESGLPKLLIEEPQTTPTGDTITLLTNKLPLRNANGEITGVLGTYMDITDRKRIEERNQNLRAQLTQAQKMESVGRLAGGVAHDFNNMLGVILGYTELALNRVEPAEPLHADLEEIRKAAHRSADLTRQLLAFARKQTIAPKVLDLNQTVAGMLKMLKRLIGENIDLAWKPGEGIWPVKMDPAQIDQILANLCVNARDAIAGIGMISVETINTVLDEESCAQQAGLTPGEHVLLTVSDDGCGMDSKTLLLLFEPFFTTKEVGKGTGLGLATVYGIVKQNNGFINVYSEPGQGTTFKIYLPRHVAKTELLPERVPAGPAARGHETILVVEDEPAILKMTIIMLENQGYTVLAASTPGEAILLAKEHRGRINLLLTDVVMPEMNGRDLAKNLLSLCPSLKRLFMSGYTANVIAHHGVLDEGEHFIQKPFSLKDLEAKLREVLEG